MMANKTIALIGCDTSDDIKNALIEKDFRLLVLPYDNRLPSPVRSHTDMLIFPIEDHIFTSSEYFNKAHDIFSVLCEYGYNIIKCDVEITDKYPHDIAFNMAILKKSILGNIKYNAKEILDFADKNGFSITPVKQGYTKCSSLILGDNAIITSDEGIAKSAADIGTSVLKIENSADSVVLEGYNYGFIGGASGVFKNTVYFSGDIAFHRYAKEIYSFCKSFNFEVESLTDGRLTDIGGIMFFPCLKSDKPNS